MATEYLALPKKKKKKDNFTLLQFYSVFDQINLRFDFNWLKKSFLNFELKCIFDIFIHFSQFY